MGMKNIMNILKVFWRRLWVKRLSWGHLVIILVVLLGALQIVHITLLSRLEVHNTRLKRASSLHKIQEETERLFYSMKSKLESSWVLDSSGHYKLVNNLLSSRTSTSNIPFKKSPSVGPEVTLLSHCSLHHIHHIAHLSKRWPGPVSVAVFTSVADIPFTLELILQLYYCVPSMRYNVSIHLVLPFSNIDISIPSKLDDPMLYTCGNLAEKVHKQQKLLHNYELDGVQYPNNLLRNVAWINAHTPYIFAVDIDMLPNADLYTQFTDYVKRQYSDSQTNFVYVVPAFEIQPHIPLPQNKEELLLLWKQNKLRPFYYDLCWKCQRPTDYDAWKTLGLSKNGHRSEEKGDKSGITDTLNIGYEVTWVDPWEPFFIAPKNAPLYDERFKQYGFNRISQVCEVHIAGYNFAVLNNAFLVHKGLKLPDSFHPSKNEEQERNRLLFREFKEQLKVKYPSSNRRC